MSKEEAITIAKEAINELLQYAEDGLIWDGDGTKETEEYIEAQIKDYQEAYKILKEL